MEYLSIINSKIVGAVASLVHCFVYSPLTPNRPFLCRSALAMEEIVDECRNAFIISDDTSQCEKLCKDCDEFFAQMANE